MTVPDLKVKKRELVKQLYGIVWEFREIGTPLLEILDGVRKMWGKLDLMEYEEKRENGK
jgi:hypothetical protein